MNRIIYLTLLISMSAITACSFIDKNVPISHVEVAHKGQSLKNRPNMASSCKGFFLSDKQVMDFYHNASTIDEELPREKYEILPCYSTGTAYIYGVKYNWIIRAGGVGEFHNDKKRFVMICGKECCKKVKRIC